MAEKIQDLLDENARLRARLRELEFERSKRNTRNLEADESTEDLARDIPSNSIDEFNKLFRGAVLASVEQLRVAAEAVNHFTNEVSRRSDMRRDAAARTTADPDTSERRDPIVEVTANLPRDLFAGVLKAIDHSFNMPSRAVKAFYDSYVETERLQDRPKKSRVNSDETDSPKSTT